VTDKPAEALQNILSDQEYLRQRLHPGIFDAHYLHLKDLAALLARIAPQVQGDVFDYGCGGAPYRGLFAQCSRYVGADVEAGPKVDRVLRPEGLTNEPNASYDFVLSTQVLEHVQNPRQYVEECSRILRPQGRVLLTTHGMFEEHGCPHDYQRWTPIGLEGLFRQGGFEIVESGKLTTEIRGMIQLMTYFARHLRRPKKPLFHFPMAVCRTIYLGAAAPLLNKIAGLFEEQGVVNTPCDDSIYVGIFVHARKPGTFESGAVAASCRSG
jgi:SAM-dependent methyltransferase